ncbi:hypothetical protein ABKA04_001513 [Annulohypoxylon sp. FPYF3050]
MSADKDSRSLSEKRNLLRKLQENYRRLRAHAVLTTDNIEELNEDQDTQVEEQWEFIHTYPKRLRRQGAKKTQSEDLLDRKIESYRSRVKRISVQLLTAAAASKSQLNRHKAGLPSGSDWESENDDTALAKAVVSVMKAGPALTKAEAIREASYQVKLDIEENIYDTSCWDSFLPVGDIDSQLLMDDAVAPKFKNPRDSTSVGLWTWEEQEESFPVLDSVFKMQRKDESEVGDLGKKTEEAKSSPETSSPEADITTLLSIARQRGFELLDGDPNYEYSRLPQNLPAKLSDEEMRRGPLPALPQIPLASADGRGVNTAGQPTQPIEPVSYAYIANFDKVAQAEPLPVAHYHYPVDSPTVSAFRFSDGRQVSDIVKPGPLHEPHQVRSGREIVDYGRQVEAESSTLKKPYDLKEDSLLRRRERLRKQAEDFLSGRTAKDRAPSLRGGRSRGPRSPQNDQASLVQQSSMGPFWHYHNVNDSESHLHSDKMKTSNVF